MGNFNQVFIHKILELLTGLFYILSFFDFNSDTQNSFCQALWELFKLVEKSNPIVLELLFRGQEERFEIKRSASCLDFVDVNFKGIGSHID